MIPKAFNVPSKWDIIANNSSDKDRGYLDERRGFLLCKRSI